MTLVEWMRCDGWRIVRSLPGFHIDDEFNSDLKLDLKNPSAALGVSPWTWPVTTVPSAWRTS
jgi:hypothetical protein